MAVTGGTEGASAARATDPTTLAPSHTHRNNHP